MTRFLPILGWLPRYERRWLPADALADLFILGFAIGIIINQVHSLLGTAGGDGSYVEQLWKTVGQIPDADLTTVAVGVGSLALLLGALAVIFVGYSESLAAARAMGTKHGYEIDPNQELIAQGAACARPG